MFYNPFKLEKFSRRVSIPQTTDGLIDAKHTVMAMKSASVSLREVVINTIWQMEILASFRGKRLGQTTKYLTEVMIIFYKRINLRIL